MAGFTIILGEITADQFNRGNVGICYIVKVSAVIAERYRYADIYSALKKLYTLNRTRIESRHRVGAVSVLKEPSQSFIITPVAHFGSGEPLETNWKNQAYLKTSTEEHFLDGIKLDTLSGRVRYLQRCIEFLSDQLLSMPINIIFIPSGSGSTLSGDTWEKKVPPCL